MIYPPVPKAEVNVVAFDLDGTLAEGNWPSPSIGEPIEEGIKMLRHYAELGNAIIVYTARPKSHEQMIWNWIFDHELEPYVYNVVCDKPLAVLYVDDRAFKFQRPVKTEIRVHTDECDLTKKGECSCDGGCPVPCAAKGDR